MTRRLFALFTLWFILCAGMAGGAFTPGHLPTDRAPAQLSQQGHDALADLAELAELAAEPDTPAENGLSAESLDWPDALIRVRQSARVCVSARAWPCSCYTPLTVLPPDLPRRPPRAHA